MAAIAVPWLEVPIRTQPGVTTTLRDLTVVIATYNSSAFIRDTIASALACAPATVIIADDASADDTLSVVRSSFTSPAPNLILLTAPKNIGLTRNWNRAIQQVDTAYCLKLDHDDLALPAYVREAIQFMRTSEDVAIIAGRAGDIPDGVALDSLLDRTPEPGCITRLAGTAACRMVLDWAPYPCSSSTIYRTAAWREVGGFDTRLSYCNDREIWFRLAARRPIAFCNDVGALVRIHESNYTKEILASERVPYECEHMFRSAYTIWRGTGVDRAFAGKFRAVAKNYIGSALRVAAARPIEVPARLYAACRTMAQSIVVEALARFQS
ncbi:MAG: glycosyltransferase [Bryobacteraceae bacterium]